MKVNFFKLHKNKRFEYIPRYYDEQKEELNERVKRIEMEMGVNTNSSERAYASNIRGQMRSHYNRNVRERKQSGFRLILILIALFLLAYIIFFKAIF